MLVRPGADPPNADGRRPEHAWPLPVPEGLACAIVHPHVEVATREARAILPASIPLGDTTQQMGNVAALVDGLHRGDFEQIGRALVDRIAEPHRKAAIPGFGDMMQAAREAGALGGSISGSGPSVFALCRGLDVAHRVAEAMRGRCPIESDVYVSRVGGKGARVVFAEET